MIAANDLFLLIFYLTLIAGVATLLAFAAEWLEHHPEAPITRWLDRALRSVGL